MIICLGESIVAIGLGAYSRPLSPTRLVAVTLGLLTTVGMWWTYFDNLAATAEARLREHEDPVLAAAASAVAMSTAALVGALCVVETVNDREALA